MRLTLSAIKADVGSIGGHTKPTHKMIDAVKKKVSGAIAQKLGNCRKCEFYQKVAVRKER